MTIKHGLPVVTPDNSFDIPDSIDILGRQLKCTLLPDRLTFHEKYMGRRFQITNENEEKTLYLELFALKRRLKDNKMDPVENGFFKHFY